VSSVWVKFMMGAPMTQLTLKRMQGIAKNSKNSALSLSESERTKEWKI